ncbi:U3 small nucleolar RNA-interacting protein 2 [Microplitis demolitor]|uniref:U3 small nucleolar RNA-interacting protein 2 n=1 Tax=Microplitis demolitor TaxID=69319 RepID=UPI0004CD18B7|nr:U3 small nucleolar RNA-interacting protein 2 [Microplitis demolitor]
MSSIGRKHGQGIRKRKVNDKTKNNAGSNLKSYKKSKKEDDNESIASSDEEFAEENLKKLEANRRDDDFESDNEEETAEEKRVKLAKLHLSKIKAQENNGELDDGEDVVARRLQEEYLEEKGRLRKTVARNYVGHEDFLQLKCKNHRDSITCLCISNNGKFLYSGSKDGTIIKWSLSDRTKVNVIGGKNKKDMKSILCMAVSSDDKFFTVGQSKSNDIKVYNGDNLTFIKNLQGHRGDVSGLVFRRDTHTLYSASQDRSVKVWNLDDMVYVESLFGHQSPITSIDAMSQERCITSGGYDRSIRLWKIVQESQLIFNDTESSSSVDTVKFINDQHFLSCGDNGQLCLWSVMKKKPLYSVTPAHGVDATNGEPMWITSIAVLLNTDLVASGSRDGNVKLWECEESFKSLKLLFQVKVTGFINSMVFTPDGKNLIVGVGQEHKTGRWWRIPEAKNRVIIIPLTKKNNK